MNCNTCRYELSLCLDGRLASGRRALVMQHVDACEACTTFWNELQAAQRLVLVLPSQEVGEDFRDQLWERIRSGEGTPDAVFHEPVPMLTKARYALTGAAAAAAVLLCATWLRTPTNPPARTEGPVADVQAPDNGTSNRVIGGPDARLASTNDDVARLDDNPLLASAQRLTTDVFALEAARQMERRHATVHLAMRRIDDDTTNKDTAVEQALTNADEFLTFGECLLDLRDRKQLIFDEPDVEADLRFAVRMLGRSNLHRRDVTTVRDVVGPAMQSALLGRVSSTISLKALDPRRERDVLVQLNAQRPEVFRMLFFVFGSDDDLRDPTFLRRGPTFVLDDTCGPSWVAPRSEVEAREMWNRALQSRGNGPGRSVDVRIQVQTNLPR